MTDFDEIRLMLDIMDEHGLEEFELEQQGVRVRFRKRPSGAAAPRRVEDSTKVAVPSPAEPIDDPAGEQMAADGFVLVKSPIVGTFYRAPEPDADPFVDVGSSVQKGQTLCIIEAMKLMNEIDAELDGEIMTVFVESGQPVQYGETLFAIKPA